MSSLFPVTFNFTDVRSLVRQQPLDVMSSLADGSADGPVLQIYNGLQPFEQALILRDDDIGEISQRLVGLRIQMTVLERSLPSLKEADPSTLGLFLATLNSVLERCSKYEAMAEEDGLPLVEKESSGLRKGFETISESLRSARLKILVRCVDFINPTQLSSTDQQAFEQIQVAALQIKGTQMATGQTSTPTTTKSPPKASAKKPAKRTQSTSAPSSKPSKKKQSSNAGGLILVLLTVAALGGGGFLFWSYQSSGGSVGRKVHIPFHTEGIDFQDDSLVITMNQADWASLGAAQQQQILSWLKRYLKAEGLSSASFVTSDGTELAYVQ